ncbi:MAG: class I tRNA ligase family protein, partial [Candidatus Paceibacterota bacterium]
SSLAELQEYVPKSGNTYTLMRHSEAKSNVTGEIDSIPDENNPLTEKGEQQNMEAANVLKDEGVDLIIHSGIQRTRDTALSLARELNLSEEQIIADTRITELKTGATLEGKSWGEYEAMYENYNEKFTKYIEGVENRHDVQKRVGEFLYELEEKYQNKKILIIGHGSSLFALRCVAEGANVTQAVLIRKEGYLANAEMMQLPFTPLPHNDDYELDYHRPYIDDITLVDTDGTTLVRVPDVFDCWFESGSMPYGQHHYPFEHKKEFEQKFFPANFIAEGLDQTRGWFYSLLVLGVALFDTSPYQNVIVNGLIMAEDGRKMSKKLQNYPDPIELTDRIGADAIRFYMLSSSIIKGEDLNFSEKEAQELQRKNIGRLHNVLAMYEEYAADDMDVETNDSSHVLDRWIIARLNQLVMETTEGFKKYELDHATRPITDFIDDVSVWYVRRSRDRLKSDDVSDKNAALGTLHHVLKTLALVMAPSMPFYAEYLWSSITTDTDVESVHLAAWPKKGPVDAQVLEEMARTRQIVSQALEARTKAGVKVRQPLQTLRVKHEVRKEAESYHALIRDEVNVKEVVHDPTIKNEVALDTTITSELKAEGAVRDFTRAVQDARKQDGLSPHDRILLTVRASDDGKKILTDFTETIRRTVGADEIVFADTSGTHVTAGNHEFVIRIEKRS